MIIFFLNIFSSLTPLKCVFLNRTDSNICNIGSKHTFAGIFMPGVKKVLSAPFEFYYSGSFHTGYVTGLPCGGWGSWEGICVREWCCSGYTLTIRYRHKNIHADWFLKYSQQFPCSGLATPRCHCTEKKPKYTWHATCCCSCKLNKGETAISLLFSVTRTQSHKV